MSGALRALLPGGVVFAVALATIGLVDDPTLDLVTGRYAIVLYCAGALLAGAFHRSRVVTALAALAFIHLMDEGVAGELNPFEPVATAFMALLALLAVTRDRGVFSRGGVVQLLGAALIGYLAFLGSDDPALLAGFWDVQLIPTAIPTPLGLPGATVAVGAAAVAATIYGAYRWRGPVERALLWSELLLLGALVPAVGDAERALLLMTAGLVLAISVLETSYFMAYRDELTGLPARRALVHDLDQLSGTYTIAMVDVDHFKQFNDKYGHDVGDQVLQLVASRLASGPGGGKAYRYGGEEFTLLYPGRLRDDALPHAEAVRAAVEKATFSLRAWNRPRKKPDGTKAKKKKKRPKKLSVTVSVGLADSGGKDVGPEDVLKKADKALYRAKGDGRNRVAK